MVCLHFVFSAYSSPCYSSTVFLGKPFNRFGHGNRLLSEKADSTGLTTEQGYDIGMSRIWLQWGSGCCTFTAWRPICLGLFNCGIVFMGWCVFFISNCDGVLHPLCAGVHECRSGSSVESKALKELVELPCWKVIIALKEGNLASADRKYVMQFQHRLARDRIAVNWKKK